MLHCSYPCSAFFCLVLFSFLLYLFFLFHLLFLSTFILHFLATNRVLFTCLVHQILPFQSLTSFLQRTENDQSDHTNTQAQIFSLMH